MARDRKHEGELACNAAIVVLSSMKMFTHILIMRAKHENVLDMVNLPY
jgi:hypothetical protein